MSTPENEQRPNEQQPARRLKLRILAQDNNCYGKFSVFCEDCQRVSMKHVIGVPVVACEQCGGMEFAREMLKGWEVNT